MLFDRKSLRTLFSLDNTKQIDLKAMTGLMAVLDFLKEEPLADDLFFNALDTALSQFLKSEANLQILVHQNTEPKKWKNVNSNQAQDLSVGEQLFFLKGDQSAYSFGNESPLVKHLVSSEKIPEFQQGVLFRIQKRYYLLLITEQITPQRTVQKVLISYLTNLEHICEKIGRLDGQGILFDRLRQEQKTTKAQLLEAERGLRRRAYEIDNILEISTELYSILDLPQLLNSALLILVGQIGCEKAFSLLRSPRGGSYSEQYMKGFGDEKFDFKMDWKQPLVDYLIKRKQPVYTADLYELPEMKKVVDQFKQKQIQILAPLVYSNRLLGIVGCGSKIFGNAFDAHDLQLFSILANIISVSVSNAQMYENVRKMSLTDAMTDLNNYRSFKERLKEEINRAKRQNSSVSLLMLDIDHFKNYNDTLGHQAGDEALRQLGAILKQVSRDEDIVNRYGGEEFTVILPGQPKDSIHILAERIRIKVEEEEFYSQEVQPQKRLTISLGGACLPSDADNFDDLVRCADEAMYKSKQNGRNRFTLYQ